MPERLSDYCYLCFNCGSITPYDAWGVFFYTDAGERRKPKPNETDPVLECPVCLWEHIDDDSNPGIIDGTRQSCEAERQGALEDWGEGWAVVMAEVLSQEHNPEQLSEVEFEYGIRHVATSRLHRWGMTRTQAVEWIDGWLQDGGKPKVWLVVRRALGPWTPRTDFPDDEGYE